MIGRGIARCVLLALAALPGTSCSGEGDSAPEPTQAPRSGERPAPTASAPAVPRRQQLLQRLDEFEPLFGVPSRRYLSARQDPYRNDDSPLLRVCAATDSLLRGPELAIPESARLELAVGTELFEAFRYAEGQSPPEPGQAGWIDPALRTPRTLRTRFRVGWIPRGEPLPEEVRQSGRIPEPWVLGETQLEVEVGPGQDRWVRPFELDLAGLAGQDGAFLWETVRLEGEKDQIFIPTWWSPVVVSPPAPDAPRAASAGEEVVEVVVADLLRGAAGTSGPTTRAAGGLFWRAPGEENWRASEIPPVVLGRHAVLDRAGNPRVEDGIPITRPLEALLAGVEAHFDTGPPPYLPDGGSRPALAFAGDCELRFDLGHLPWQPGQELVFSVGFYCWSQAPIPRGKARLTVTAGGQRLRTVDWSAVPETAPRGWSAPIRIELPEPGDGRRALDLSVELEGWTGVERVELPGPRPLPAEIERPWFGVSRPRIVQRRTVPNRRRPRSAKGGHNVLFLCVETLRADALHCYGGPDLTPHLDSLAQRSLLFERAYAPSPWTLPSVASYLTGLEPHRHRARTETEELLGDWSLTLAEAASQSGVRCLGVVSNELLRPETGFAAGFQDYLLASAANARQVNQQLLDWLSVQGDRRFFAYVHYFEPHSPWNAPGEYRNGAVTEALRDTPYHDTESRVKKALTRGDANLAGRDSLEYLRGRYQSEVRYLDEQLGALLAELERRGYLEDTLIILTADHGEEFGEDRWFGHGCQLNEVTLRVPLLVLGPGVRPERIATPVSVERIATQAAAAALGLDDYARWAGLPLRAPPLDETSFVYDLPIRASTEKAVDLRGAAGEAFLESLADRVRPRSLRALIGETRKQTLQLSRASREWATEGHPLQWEERWRDSRLGSDPAAEEWRDVATDEVDEMDRHAFREWLDREREELYRRPALATRGTSQATRQLLEELGYTAPVRDRATGNPEQEERDEEDGEGSDLPDSP